MSTRTELHHFTDFDRLFIKKNFIVTLLGSILAFSFSYFSETIIPIADLGPPYGLSFTITTIMIVSVYTKNIASSGIVSLVGGLGIVSPRGGDVDWALSYILILFILSISLGRLADRLRLVFVWTKFYLIGSILFSFFLVVLSITSNASTDDYNRNTGNPDLSKNYNIGGTDDFGIIDGWPIYEIAVVGALTLLVLFILFITRGQIILDRKSCRKYKIIGYLFILIGQAVSFVSLYLFSTSVTQDDMVLIARVPTQLNTLQDLISHHTPGDYYAITIAPINIFMVIAITTVFTSIGLSLLYIGRNQGNVEGMKGGNDIVLLSAPISLFIFQIGGSYLLQNLIYPGGFFISEELMAMFTTMIYAMLYYSQIIARVSLFILNKIIPNK